jgi:hypothetical protein
MKEQARNLVYHRNAHPVGVSHITIGEAFHGIARDRKRDCDRVMGKFVELMVEQNKIVLYGIRDLGRYREIIDRLEGESFELRPCDCQILAAALLDNDCRIFYSADPDFISSPRLEVFCRKEPYRTRIVSWD